MLKKVIFPQLWGTVPNQLALVVGSAANWLGGSHSFVNHNTIGDVLCRHLSRVDQTVILIGLMVC